MTNKIKVSLKKCVGKGYNKFWHFKGRYRAIKGSRRSKKSKTMALWLIANMMKYEWANSLVVRKTYRSLKDSCFTELKWAIHRLKVDNYWDVKESPLEMTYKPTGQKIYFRGLDDPLKVTSITTEVGILAFLWIEEAYEITSEEDFDTLYESMLGDCPEGAFKQVTLTFNPWNERHWLKHRFFDEIVGKDEEGNPIYKPREEPISKDGEILAMTTNYLCNEWLSEEDKKVFNDMAKRNPRRYQVAGLGHWGIVDGLVYENWKEKAFTFVSKQEYNSLANKEDKYYVVKDNLISCFGLDYGYTNDPTALFCGMLDLKDKKLYVFDELYQKGMSNKRISEEITRMGYAKEQIIADSAEPKSNDELRGYGLRVKGAVKGKDSVNNGIQWVQDLEIIIHPRCVNFLTEISNYTWAKDKFDRKLNIPIDDFNHLMDSMRYALEKYIAKNGWLF